jgi:hypothetical protein
MIVPLTFLPFHSFIPIRDSAFFYVLALIPIDRDAREVNRELGEQRNEMMTKGENERGKGGCDGKIQAIDNR